jgi:large subunit ribosomal protein L19
MEDDTVDVVVKIQEGEKERKQIFQGTVLSFHGHGISKSFTVRRIVQGEGVERVFPIHSPQLVTVRVKRKGKVRRAKLYYLRERVGKATKVKEKIWDSEEAKKVSQLADEAAQEVDALTANDEKNVKKDSKKDAKKDAKAKPKK